MPITKHHPEYRRLRDVLASFFAPEYRALERYGEGEGPTPTIAEVIDAGKRALEWHKAAEIGFAAEANEAYQLGNLAKADRLAMLRQAQRDHVERIQAELEKLQPVQLAAE